MTAHDLISKLARMTPGEDADDNAATLARLIDEARKIVEQPHGDNAGLIERLREQAYEGMLHMKQKPVYAGEMLRAIESAEARAVEADRENYELRLIITGGEDAPGYVNSLTLDNLREDHARLLREYGDAIDWRERQLAAAREAIDELGGLVARADWMQLVSDKTKAFCAALSDAPAPVSGFNYPDPHVPQYPPGVMDAPAPVSGLPTFRHTKRGTIYTVLGPARLQTDQPLADMADLVVYRSHEGELWARPTTEFNDGRFEQIDAPASAEPAP